MNSRASFDHLVCASKQCRRHVEAQRLCCFQVDDKIKFGRRLHGKVGGLLTLEDTINIIRRATILVDRIRPIGDKASASGPITIAIDGGKALPGSQCNDLIAVFDRGPTGRND